MIQEIAPHHFDNAYQRVSPKKDSLVLCYKERGCLLRYKKKEDREEILFPTFRELANIFHIPFTKLAEKENWIYLFSIDETAYYMLTDTKEEDRVLTEAGYTYENIETFRRAKPQYRAFAGVTGHQLYNWYRKHRFCGQCGGRMTQDEKERMLYCPECKTMEYPKISPAVIIAVTDGNRILLSKYAGRTYRKYALLAGYTEIGETVEETVAREVMEEVGLQVKNIRYYKSQPWSFTETILMGFFCELSGSANITLDTKELALAEWFEREEIPVEPTGDSLTNEMILVFKQGKI